ncbi:MAG TPA: hypothetical protein VEQ16_06795 [Acidocella sp.]|jgi:hypothetical protein|nr:hypothetical protein [Acidocella sp.]
MFQRKTVNVTSRDALDDALRTADRVIVEGDDQLLSYAVSKAACDPKNEIEVETASFDFAGPGMAAPAIFDPAAFQMLGDSAAPPPPRLRARAGGTLRMELYGVIGFFIVLVLVGAVAVLGLQQRASFSPPPPGAAGGQALATQIATLPANDLQALAWPAVAIAAIIALFLIAILAIMNGRNVEISWQVTEKMAGRVIITKVRQRRAKEATA